LARERVEIAVQWVDLDQRLRVEIVRYRRRHDHVAAGALEEGLRIAEKCKQSGRDFHVSGI
jgi:hypothetical protein